MPEPGLSERAVLERLLDGLDDVRLSLATKVDRERVHVLETRVAGIDLIAQTVAQLSSDLGNVKGKVDSMDRHVSSLSDTLDTRIESHLTAQSERGWSKAQVLGGLVALVFLLGNLTLNIAALYSGH